MRVEEEYLDVLQNVESGRATSTSSGRSSYEPH